jgi:hypothetical protein
MKRGERVIIWTETDGLGGLEHVSTVLRRAKRIGDPVHLIITGGDTSFATRGNLPGQRMADALRHTYGSEIDFDSSVTIDGFSKNTGHQGRIVPGLLKAMGAKEVIVVAPLYHLPRFLTTIGYGSKYFADIRPKFVPMPFGTWETWHSCKEPIVENATDPINASAYARVLGYTYADLLFKSGLPRFHFEDAGAENTSEIDKIISGWVRPCTRLCADLTPTEAIDYFEI